MLIAPPVRVLLASAVPLILDGLRRRLDPDRRLQLVGCAGSGQAAVAMARSCRPDVALLGCALGDLEGALLVESLVAASPRTHVLLLAGHDHLDDTREVIMAGARGVVAIDEPVEVIVAALHTVARGEAAFSSGAQQVLVRSIGQDGRPEPPAALATAERRVLELVANGATAVEVGRSIGRSEATAKAMLRRIYAKLGVNDRAAAVAEAMRRGWLS